MKLIVCLVFIFCSSSGVLAKFYKTNTTDLSKCKIHYSRSGSIYSDFYTLSDEVSSENNTLLVDFHFAVMAPSDAHILLSPSTVVKKGDPAYEIVIGAGGDTFCDIRRSQKANVKASVRIKDLLSALDPNFFWLHISKDGNIELGKEGQELPFISWVDPDPLPLKYISFSAWSGIEAKWYFDCERPNEIQHVERNLTYTEKLRRDVLAGYNPYVRPVKDLSTPTIVTLALHINRVQLDERKSTIDILGMTKLTWQDEIIIWNPEDYGHKETLHIYRREIWQPELFLYNSVEDGRDITKDSLMVAQSSGLIEWNPLIFIKAWCNLTDMAKWPKDVHKCDIVLGFIKEYDFVKLKFNKNDSSWIDNEESEWAVLEVDIREINSVPFLKISFTIQRMSNSYNTIFFTPFLIISVSLLSTFWVDAFGKLKMSLNCTQLIISTIMLLLLGTFIPSHSVRVPYLVLLYSSSLVATLISILIAIVVINLSRNTQKLTVPVYICKAFTSNILRIGLLLPKIEKCDEYGKLVDPFLKSAGKNQLMWILLGTAIDRLSFLIYLPIVIYANYLSYT